MFPVVSITRDGRDGCGLNREKSGLTFSSFNDMPVKFAPKIIMIIAT